MSTKYVVFENRAAEAEGLVALARKTHVDALPGGVYKVCEHDLTILHELKLGYRIATHEEARRAAEGVLDSPSAKV